MSRRNTQEYIVWSSVVPQAITSSTDATPIVITKASHGYVTGNRVIINGHTTNVAANGYYSVTRVDANTFSLQNYNTGANIAGSGAGAGGASGVVALAPKILDVTDFQTVVFSFMSSGSLNATVKVAGSIGKLATDATAISDETPNFGGTISKSNPYSFVQIINLDTAAAVNGATGVTSAGTDLQNTYEVNVNALKYLTFVPTAWTAGTITIKALLVDNL